MLKQPVRLDRIYVNDMGTHDLVWFDLAGQEDLAGRGRFIEFNKSLTSVCVSVCVCGRWVAFCFCCVAVSFIKLNDMNLFK